MTSKGVVPEVWLRIGVLMLVVGVILAQPALILVTALLVAAYGIAWVLVAGIREHASA